MRTHLTVFAALLVGCSASADSQGSAPTVVLTNVTVISGTGAAAQPGMSIVLRDGRIAAIARSGVKMLAGTDAIGQRVPNIHLEMRLLVEQVGLTPLEAIQAATQHGAIALGLADSTGTVEVGKWADLVVLRADPSANIRNTSGVRMVFRGGVRYEP